MLESKISKNEAITIPVRVAKKLSLKDGMIIEAKVEKGKLLILGKKDKIAKVMKYAGIWEDEDVDSVFREIRKDWHKWKKSLSV